MRSKEEINKKIEEIRLHISEWEELRDKVSMKIDASSKLEIESYNAEIIASKERISLLKWVLDNQS